MTLLVLRCMPSHCALPGWWRVLTLHLGTMWPAEVWTTSAPYTAWRPARATWGWHESCRDTQVGIVLTSQIATSVGIKVWLSDWLFYNILSAALPSTSWIYDSILKDWKITSILQLVSGIIIGRPNKSIMTFFCYTFCNWFLSVLSIYCCSGNAFCVYLLMLPLPYI